MTMPIICPCPSQHHGLSHWKCVLRCCEKCPSITISNQDKNKDATNMFSKIRFHVYRDISRCIVHGIGSYE